jgi:voltage-gated potassium channel
MSLMQRIVDRFQDASDTLKEVIAYYILLVFFAAVVFSAAEGVGFWEALYWGGTTTTTTGYGDISPKSPAGRAIALLAMHVSIFIISPLVIARVINYVNRDKHQFTHEEQQDLVDRLERIERLLVERERGA